MGYISDGFFVKCRFACVVEATKCIYVSMISKSLMKRHRLDPDPGPVNDFSQQSPLQM